MSEVKRYAVWASPVSDGPTWVEFTQDLRNNFPDAKGYVREEDFDRVTAERDALQQRLTAADEREDALCSLAPEAELALKALNVAVSVYDVELADRARRGLRLIIAALKPAEGRGDEG